MRLKFILDPLLYMLILLRLCSLGICSLPVLSFSRVLFAPLVLIKAKCIEQVGALGVRAIWARRGLPNSPCKP